MIGTHTITASAMDLDGATGSASVTILVNGPGGGSMVTLPVTADSYTRNKPSSVNTNYGGSDVMRVEVAGERASFAQFDISSLSGPVSSAILNIPVDTVTTPGSVGVHQVQQAWTEIGITHSNRPSFTAAPAATFAISPSDVGDILQIDITSLVAAWQSNPSTAYGIALINIGSTRVHFDTKEAGNGAFVEVTTGGGSGNATPVVNITSPGNNDNFTTLDVVNLVATANDTENGNLASSINWSSSLDGPLGSTGSIMVGSLTAGTHTITASAMDLDGATGSASVTIFVTNPGGSTMTTLPVMADSYTRNKPSSVNSNYGNTGVMRVEIAGERASFAQFDISSLSGPVSSAILNISVDTVTTPGSVGVHQVQQAWTEIGITHNNRPSFNAAPATTFAVSASDAGDVLQVDITSLVAAWQSNPPTAFGIALINIGSTRVHFDTKEAGSGAFVDVTMN